MYWELPSCLHSFDVISRGATGWVFQICDEIALKYTRKGRLGDFLKENAIYDLLEEHRAPPALLQSFLRLPGINFMPLMAGTLDQRINGNQRRDYQKARCLEVLKLEPTQKIEHWAMELSGAISWLASIGLAHGDLRPANMLLDFRDHLKLADFDCASDMGSDHQGSAPPWSRMLGPEAGIKQGTYGVYGAESEQFTFGVILYTITRGIVLYEEDPSGAVLLLQKKIFPPLSDGHLDRIIDRCWKGQYDSLAELAEEMASLEGAKTTQATLLDDEHVAKMHWRCTHLLATKLSAILVDSVTTNKVNNVTNN
ncbi:unnamed protein product [Clonostachys solani]|uniref:Protein kinase domain-containing protein n=1 Tax=Clonostachys solani TaxID=160281 RepID=A0A9N9Z2M9_9HYPO|nr:unnamed protein product [Clonostachys solani]